MCSILGIHYFFDKAVTSRDFQNIEISLEKYLSRRGPDDSFITSPTKHTSMAGTRLAIVCDPEFGEMPFKSDGVTCCYNGEIYNYAEHGDVVSDGEILIPLYRKYGMKFLDYLDGEFAMSIFDENRNELFLVSDFFASKPLYFLLTPDMVVWGSSEAAIQQVKNTRLCCSIQDPVYQHTFTSQQPYTNYDRIWRVPPGHYLKATENEIELICYNHWQLKKNSPVSTAMLYSKIEQIFATRLKHNDCLAIPMSGGIDSGLIALIADRLGVKYEIFSVDKMFSEATEETEAIYRRLDTLKNCSSINLIDVSAEIYSEAVSSIYSPGYYDSFRLDSGMIPAYALYKQIADRGINVVVDGTGGDELFHGYRFRGDFTRIQGWPPMFEECKYFYSMFSSLISYTDKSDRAAGYFSIENRVPFQSRTLMELALSLEPSEVTKWPLRAVYDLEASRSGKPLLGQLPKYGFSLKNYSKSKMHCQLKVEWLNRNGINERDLTAPTEFPFNIG